MDRGRKARQLAARGPCNSRSVPGLAVEIGRFKTVPAGDLLKDRTTVRLRRKLCDRLDASALFEFSAVQLPQAPGRPASR